MAGLVSIMRPTSLFLNAVIAIAIASELSVPVKYIGVGEGIDDLLKFDPEAFAQAMFEGTDTDEE